MEGRRGLNLYRAMDDDSTKISHHDRRHHLFLRRHGFFLQHGGGGYYQAYPSLLPLLPLLPPAAAPPLWPPRTPPVLPTPRAMEVPRKKPSYPIAKKGTPTVTPSAKDYSCRKPPAAVVTPTPLVIAKRPDGGGQDGRQVLLLANHFRVEFDHSQMIFHYDMEISPRPSKELARLIKKKLLEDNAAVFSGYPLAFDGRRNLYSPVQLLLESDRVDFLVALPDGARKKPFTVSVKLVSKLSAEGLTRFLEGEDNADEAYNLPQDMLHALDVVLRENAMEKKCFPVGRSLFSATSAGGAAEDIGGAAVALRGFFQSLRPTQQGLALNVDFSVMAFHEPVSVIFYLQKRFDFLRDLPQRKTRGLAGEEKKAVEKALKNLRISVCHRRSDQRLKILGLTEESTKNLRFKDREGRELTIVDYYRDQYEIDLQFRNLPCLQISRSKPCYLPMELCHILEGQKVLGKLSDEQTAKLRRMGCQKPGKRRQIIDAVMGGASSPASGPYAAGFNLRVAAEMTRLNGRVLPPPKLKLGDGGHVRELTPSRPDRQWSLLDSHVAEGSSVRRWALVNFGGSPEQLSFIPRFVSQLSHRCLQLGISLSRTPAAPPLFEPMQTLCDPALLESKLRQLHSVAAAGELQLLICVMERKHRGYGELKRIAETAVGVMTQCCLLSNVAKPSFQFLSNLALKINVKLGGCNVALCSSSPLLPPIFSGEEAAIFMGADVTHPHPLDDVSPSVAAVVGSVDWPATKYAARMRSQTHREEIIQDLEDMAAEILGEFLRRCQKLPEKIVFFRDGVSESMFHKVLKDEVSAIRAACKRFPNYEPRITFAVVQKRHHTRLFGAGGAGDEENIPPGTVVDSVITHPREFDFYLCSHWGTKGTTRPTRYHVLWDENRFSSDELQSLVHSLCYTFARCTKPVSLVPPAYYAHLAAYRGRMYIVDGGGAPAVCRAAAPQCAPPLPKVRDSVNKLMFYC